MRYPNCVFLRRHKVKLAASALIILCLGAGILLINEGLFHYDSVVLARAVEKTYATGRLQGAVRGRYGAVIINCIFYLPFSFFSRNADLSIRLSSILFYSLSIAALFLFVYELFGDFVQAVFSGLLFAFTPFYFSPNTYGKEHGLSIFFLLSAFYLLCLGVKKSNFVFMGLASLLYIFAVSVREAMLMLLPLYILLYLHPDVSIRPFKFKIAKEKMSFRSLAALLLPLLAAFSLVYFTYLKNEFLQEMIIRDGEYAHFLGLYSYIFRTAVHDLYKSIPALVFIFALIGLRRLLRGENIFFALFVVCWGMLFFYFANITIYKPRYLDVVIIPVYILAAYVLSLLYAKEKLIASGICAFLVLNMFMYMYPMLAFRHRYNGEKQFALFVKANTEENAVIISMDDAVFIEYYGQRKTFTHPKYGYKKMHEFLRRVAAYLVKDVPVYLTASGLSYDSQQRFRSILLTNFDLKVIGSKLSEDYHQPELNFAKYDQDLYKLTFKFK